MTIGQQPEAQGQMDIESFLRDSVLYPCSGTDGRPVKLLGKRFTRFFYVDGTVDHHAFETEIVKHPFNGYSLRDSRQIEPSCLIGDLPSSWEAEVSRRLQPQSWARAKGSFLVRATFRRDAGLEAEHGPSSFDLLFAQGEAITTIDNSYVRRSIAPKCLAYFRVGIGFGRNFRGFATMLEELLRSNKGGLPEFVVYDQLARHGGDQFPLIDGYVPQQTFEGERDGPIILARRRDMCTQGF